MLIIIFTLVGFILLTGLTIVIVEASNAPLMADDDMTIIPRTPKEDNEDNAYDTI